MPEFFPSSVRSGTIFNRFLSENSPATFLKEMDKVAAKASGIELPEAIYARQYFFDNSKSDVKDELLYEETDPDEDDYLFALRYSSKTSDEFDAFSAFLKISDLYSPLKSGDSGGQTFTSHAVVAYQDLLYNIIVTLRRGDDGIYYNNLMLRLVDVEEFEKDEDEDG